MSDENNKQDDDNESDRRLAPKRCTISNFCRDLTGTCRCLPSWRAVDTFHHADGSVTTQAIDVVASFSPAPGTSATVKALMIVWKVALLGVAIACYGLKYFNNPRAFFFAYLTNWALTFSTLYAVLSLMNAVLPVPPADSDGKVSVRTQWTWILFTLSGTAQLTVTFLFWALVYPGETTPPNLYQVLSHGVIFVMQWIDGLVINRIPVRMRHWTEILLPMFALFTVWSVLQSPVVFDIENPYNRENGKDHDRLYAVLDWDAKPLFSLGLVAGLAFVFTFLGHALLWGLSLVGRLYVAHDATNNSEDIDDDNDDDNDNDNTPDV